MEFLKATRIETRKQALEYLTGMGYTEDTFAYDVDELVGGWTCLDLDKDGQWIVHEIGADDAEVVDDEDGTWLTVCGDRLYDTELRLYKRKGTQGHELYMDIDYVN